MELKTRLNRRVHERYAIPPMYSPITAHRLMGPAIQPLEGHAYDISEGGVRIELDEALSPGDHVSVRIGLPGQKDRLQAEGDVMWVNEPDDDPGPRRMAVKFSQFATLGDQQRLLAFLAGTSQRMAA